MQEYTPETENQEQEETQETGESIDLKRWFQDNMRVIVSIAIVALIAGGIYSYSKRSEAPIVSDTSLENSISTDEKENSGIDNNQKAADTTKESGASVSSTATSRETETAFAETAKKGDGLTMLARRAAANYLEKNQDSTLTKEHKIYIEDYLRKNSGFRGHVKVGTTVEFSKDSIQKAIGQSKNLSEKQLRHLKIYSARVTSL